MTQEFTGNPYMDNAYADAAIHLPAFVPYMQAEKDSGFWPNWRLEYDLKLTELDYWLRDNRPKVIVELGSGLTTLVFARYAQHFPDVRHIVVEEHDEWRAKVQSRLQGSRVEWFNIEAKRMGDCYGYLKLPAPKRIDLAYIDGPNLDGVTVPCIDANRLAAQSRVEHFLFDIRHDCVRGFWEKYGEAYHCELGGTFPVKLPHYVRAKRHHTWFWRKTCSA